MPITPKYGKVSQGRTSLGMTQMAKNGLDLHTLPEFLNPGYATAIVNYFVQNNKGLSKRKGIVKQLEIAGIYAPSLLEYWKGYWIVGYNQTLAAYNPTTKVVTNIKTDWVTADPFSGVAYGNYFFVGNIGNKINYVTEAAGVFTITEITGAPKTGLIRANGPRLWCGVGTDTYFSNIDAPTTPPFQDWTITTAATSAGIESFKSAGNINSLCFLGDTTVALCDNGKYAFKVGQATDGSGTTILTETVVIDRIDMGGARGAITTPHGVFYTNEAGLWQLTSLGQPNIPFSDQEHIVSTQLGTEYFNGLDLTNCDIAYYARFSTILITCAKGSPVNNHVIAYNPDLKAFSTFNNLNINRWMTINNDVYGASSIKTVVYQMFAGNSDDGVAISCEYEQELKMMTGTGSRMRPTPLFMSQMLRGAYVKGFLHPLSSVRVAFDIYNYQGKLIKNKLKFDWTNQNNNNGSDGWGTATWGKSTWGGDRDVSGLVENFSGEETFIRNFQRIILHITESSKYTHELDYVILNAEPTATIRRRDLKLVS